MGLCMQNPEKTVSGIGYGGKSRTGCLAAGMQCAAGLLPGAFLWVSEAVGDPSQASGGRHFFPGSPMGLDLYQLRPLPG